MRLRAVPGRFIPSKPDRFLRIASVLDRTGLSRTALYRKNCRGVFPEANQNIGQMHCMARSQCGRLGSGGFAASGETIIRGSGTLYQGHSNGSARLGLVLSKSPETSQFVPVKLK